MDIYKLFLARVIDEVVVIRTISPTGMPNDAAKFMKDTNEIYLQRDSGDFYFIDKSTDDAEIEKFISDSVDPINEICILAHEFGHYHSDFSDYERIMMLYSDDPKNVTSAEKEKIFREELLAWDWGRRLLTEMKFKEIDRFEEISMKSLITYSEFNVN